MSRLPTPAGPLTAELFDRLRLAPGSLGNPALPVADAAADDDLQRALHVLYELHYRGYAEVDPAWQWDPGALSLRRELEEAFLAALDEILPPVPDRAQGDIADWLNAVIAADDGRSVPRHLARDGNDEQVREMVVHRSAALLREADPYVATTARLQGRAKAAMVEILADEYGNGRLEHMHIELYRRAMRALGLDDAPDAYVDLLPGVTLATANLTSLLGAHARWRGALVGHLAITEMTSSEPNRRVANALRRLGHGADATAYFDEHVEADAIHESIAAHDLAGGFVADQPDEADAVLFGARALVALEGRFAAHLLESWEAGRSSLLAPVPAVALAS